MESTTFQFNRKKAIETILYLAQRVSDADVYGICKLLYLADKTSLEKYGRFIFGETYSAMKEGPAPSNVYDMLKLAAEEAVNGIKVDGVKVIPMRNADLDYLSESDIECLDQIINVYGNVPNWYRARDTHDDAWRKTWDERGRRKSVRMPVESIAETLEDPDELIHYLSGRDDE